jgi:ubiquinone biosynthesis protein
MKELDFENELKNAEMTRINFINDDNLYIPKYEKNYCSNRVLTMEFIDGIKISDIQSLRENFGNTNEIGK